MPSKREPGSLRIHQAVARQIGIAILSGEYSPGDSIPTEIEQTATLNVSRTPYREAIQILRAKGLLESRYKAGTHVTPRERWNLLDPDVLAWMFAGTPDETFITDLFELRGILEPAAAALAATRRSAEQLALMKGALADMARFGLATAEGQEADRLFHRVLLEASGNQALASLSGSVGAAVKWTTHFKQRVQQCPRDPLPEHEAVWTMIAEGDAAAASNAMQQLIRLALADTSAALR
jgi:DNA-binding FadR family transcriptional regulator